MTRVNGRSSMSSGSTTTIGPLARAAAMRTKLAIIAASPANHIGSRRMRAINRGWNSSSAGRLRLAARWSTDAAALTAAVRIAST
ncbi:hypothetical protein [Tomitella gaofuii]|uniref:hypothetical protein n=1 Tax=Tomitella gaofuii TaxID=2760083 RepID=UPI0015FD2F29|nr:hypothetical protein [Tomitella gaofuii]